MAQRGPGGHCSERESRENSLGTHSLETAIARAAETHSREVICCSQFMSQRGRIHRESPPETKELVGTICLPHRGTCGKQHNYFISYLTCLEQALPSPTLCFCETAFPSHTFLSPSTSRPPPSEDQPKPLPTLPREFCRTLLPVVVATGLISRAEKSTPS